MEALGTEEEEDEEIEGAKYLDDMGDFEPNPKSASIRSRALATKVSGSFFLSVFCSSVLCNGDPHDASTWFYRAPPSTFMSAADCEGPVLPNCQSDCMMRHYSWAQNSYL